MNKNEVEKFAGIFKKTEIFEVGSPNQLLPQFYSRKFDDLPYLKVLSTIKNSTKVIK